MAGRSEQYARVEGMTRWRSGKERWSDDWGRSSQERPRQKARWGKDGAEGEKLGPVKGSTLCRGQARARWKEEQLHKHDKERAEQGKPEGRVEEIEGKVGKKHMVDGLAEGWVKGNSGAATKF